MTSAELIRAEVGGHSVAYRHAGKGPALVLLHGFLCDSRVWERQLRDLSDQFTVVAWDAPGAGSSSDPPDPFTMTDWGHCLAEFLDVVGIARAHVLGLSWGGVLAQEFYRLYPTRILGLILADTYAGWKGSLPASVCEQRLARCLLEASLPAEEFVTRWVPEFFTEAASQDLQEEMSAVVSDFHPVGFRLMAKSLADTDTTNLLPNIEVPTLLLWGDDDRRSPLSIAAQLRDAIPKAELAVIPNAGHVSNMEQPGGFNAQVRRFCLSNRSA
ncbi:MAG: hydrolase [Planctomycetes bacterium RBG_16_64_12]|nr:MAG: hydrolase [Planctomycetes bacterium RBG_16_64_12]